MYEISKADWKLLREKVPEWQEHYMERLLQKYAELLTSPGHASQHFWELEKRIRNDKRHPGVMMRLEKKEAVWDIVRLIKMDVIAVKDLEGFSQDLKDAAAQMLER